MDRTEALHTPRRSLTWLPRPGESETPQPINASMRGHQADGTYVERPKKIVKREATCAMRSSVCTSCMNSLPKLWDRQDVRKKATTTHARLGKALTDLHQPSVPFRGPPHQL